MTPDSLKVISIGADAELLWLRNAVLQSAGFDVVTTLDEKQALDRIRQGDCGVLLVCYSLESPVRRRLADAFPEHCPDSRIVAITNRAIERPEFADSFVYGVEGPEALINAVRNG